MSRQLAINRGKLGPVQTFSMSFTPDAGALESLLALLGPEVSPPRRLEYLADPSRVSQFACAWGAQMGFFTRPVTATVQGVDVVTGSFSDSIGAAIPIAVSVTAFQGSFTTLVKRSDAEFFGLEIHPVLPETVGAPGLDQDEPTMGRLNFGPIETEGDHPAVVCLPFFLPLGFGMTFPDTSQLSSPEALFRYIDMWRKGWVYVHNLNNQFSVTLGGNLFDTISFAVPGNQPQPWANMTLISRLPAPPVVLTPGTVEYASVRTRILDFGNHTWEHLGHEIPVEAPPPGAAGGGGLTAEQIGALVQPLVNQGTRSSSDTKEKEQAETATDISHQYQLAFASLPEAAAVDQDTMVLPPISLAFEKILKKTKPVLAAMAIQEQIQVKIDNNGATGLSLDQNVTLEPSFFTLRMADCLRSGHWLTQPVTSVPKSLALSKLGMINFCTPDRSETFLSATMDSTTGPVVLSHITDDSAQLEASKKSSMYTGGRCASKADIIEMVCNFRAMAIIITLMAERSVLWQKLRAYMLLLESTNGRLFLDTYRANAWLFVHIFEGFQHILSSFMAIAKRPLLREAVASGSPVSTDNYLNAARGADHLIDSLRTIIHGNGLGHFASEPVCMSWFQRHSKGGTPRTPPREDHTPIRDGRFVPQQGSNITPSPPSKGPRKDDGMAIEAKKKEGILVWRPPQGVPKSLPSCPVVEKKRGAPAPEHICMQATTRGHYCSRRECPFPHVLTVRSLSTPAKRLQFDQWVSATAGLSYATGMAPPGTSNGAPAP